MDKPVLIYDRDCSFCIYWIKYWQQLTGKKVDYQAYQDVAEDYPHIPIESFQQAIQYISPEGKEASGAEASFLTLSHAKGKGFWLWLYRHIPGFALITEWAYSLIASHRPFFYRISSFLWGSQLIPPTYNLVVWLFLRGLGCIFLIAFVSFTTQAMGIIGSQGILPVSELIQLGNEQLGAERYWYFPMVFWLNASDYAVYSVCWGGIIFSALLILNIIPRISLVVLYILYLSLVYAGQVFMSFQWDLFLIETGVISFFLLGTSSIGIWLLRWLLFRFIFAGGLVKVTSGDPSWFDFTALNYHFFTQPLPTPLAWYAQHLPALILKFSTAATLLIELFLVFLIFLPRRIRFASAFIIAFFQFLILITGNYNFFNIQTILLCLVLFDDAAISRVLPKKIIHFISQSRMHFSTSKALQICAVSFATLTIALSLIQFQIRFTNTRPIAPAMLLQNALSPLRWVSTYGPFAVMTKRRLEIIIEGSNDGVNWLEYEFKYKPGDVLQGPLWNIPFQPRLDWQMWFAALSKAEDNPWFIRFMQRILENSPSVNSLLKSNPFGDQAPLFIRAEYYDYRFSDSEEWKENGAWWVRWHIGTYLQPAKLK